MKKQRPLQERALERVAAGPLGPTVQAQGLLPVGKGQAACGLMLVLAAGAAFTGGILAAAGAAAAGFAGAGFADALIDRPERRLALQP